VKEFLEEAFSYLGMDWRDFVEIDSKYLRPTEVDVLLGDSRKALTNLGWKTKVTFKEQSKMMVDHDVEEVRKQLFGERKSSAHDPERKIPILQSI
jgi:GDPmannose 4,6-dehydratase